MPKATQLSRNYTGVLAIYSTRRERCLRVAGGTRAKSMARTYSYSVENRKIKIKSSLFTAYRSVLYKVIKDNFTWKKIEPKGKTIPQRSQFTSILYSTDVLIYGGIEPEIKNVFS